MTILLSQLRKTPRDVVITQKRYYASTLTRPRLSVLCYWELVGIIDSGIEKAKTLLEDEDLIKATRGCPR